ncbi:MAG: cytochrome c-type biosis protein CcmB [Bacteroidota bacterium]|jgi:heme exporter protein B
MKQFSALFRKEILLEWRQRYAIGGILLYVLSTVFVVYISFQNVKPQAWNALFWIISLFASVNAVAKSFIQENSKRQLYYYSLANPIALILSKIVYNTALLLGLSILAFGAMIVVAGNPIIDAPVFALAIGLGSLGFSITFTFVSAIAAKASQSGTLMAILSFPVVIPILLELIKLTTIAIGFAKDTSWLNDVYILLAIDGILMGLVVVLFPYLWRD